MKRTLRTPFLIVNPKAYIYGEEALELGMICDRLANEYDIDIIYTAQHTDLRMIKEHTEHLILTAQHMDGIVPGRGMGHILPESIKAAGAEAVVLNHAEHPLTMSSLDAAMRRAQELDLLTIVCSDTPAQAKAIASLHPDVMICEPTGLIGTARTSNDDYINATNAAIKSVSTEIRIIQAAGVSTGSDVYHVIMQGAHGSGGTSGILNAPSRKGKIIEMLDALVEAKIDLAK